MSDLKNSQWLFLASSRGSGNEVTGVETCAVDYAAVAIAAKRSRILLLVISSEVENKDLSMRFA